MNCIRQSLMIISGERLWGLLLLCSLLLPRLATADEKRLGIEMLDGPTRAGALAALAALVILWFAGIVLIWWGARITRRYMRSSIDERPQSRYAGGGNDDWAANPLVVRREAGDDEDD